MTTLPRSRITADEFLLLPEEDSYELVDGELVGLPGDMLASWLAGEPSRRMANFVAELTEAALAMTRRGEGTPPRLSSNGC